MKKLPTSRNAFFKSLQTTRLSSELVAHLTGQARPAIALAAIVCDDADIPVGASKMGGCPDLPATMVWPTRPAYPEEAGNAAEHRRKAISYLAETPSWMTLMDAKQFSATALRQAEAAESEFPLSFFLQLDLKSLASMEGFPEGLPTTGRLLFFYDHFEEPAKFDPASKIGWRLVWDETPIDSLFRAMPPRELVEISDKTWMAVFGGAKIIAESVMTPIPWSDKLWDAFSFDDYASYQAYDRWLGQFGMPDDAGGNQHLLGGFPLPMQSSMQATAQLAANGIWCGHSDVYELPEVVELLKAAREWQLLLQIGPEVALGMGDVGGMYVLIREQDLLNRAFDRVWVVYDG